jgi:hypothetical protein
MTALQKIRHAFLDGSGFMPAPGLGRVAQAVTLATIILTTLVCIMAIGGGQ